MKHALRNLNPVLRKALIGVCLAAYIPVTVLGLSPKQELQPKSVPEHVTTPRFCYPLAELHVGTPQGHDVGLDGVVTLSELQSLPLTFMTQVDPRLVIEYYQSQFESELVEYEDNHPRLRRWLVRLDTPDYRGRVNIVFDKKERSTTIMMVQPLAPSKDRVATIP